MRGLAMAFALSAGAATAQDLTLDPPLDCVPGADCFIQQYVDADPGPMASDFACGTLSYDGHKGTDFALPSLATMKAGVTVHASAPGTVRGVRDGMPDVGADSPLSPRIDGRECGNGVVLTHPGGWETQYCHMARGSIRVSPGDRIERGAPLGRVGLSGQTVFPHVHLSVRKDGIVVDPFDPDSTATCADPPARTLWTDALPYRAGGIVATGLAEDVPTYEAIKAGPPPAALRADQPGLVLWGHVFGARSGDILRLDLSGPNGEIVAQDVPLDRTQARLFRAIGKRRAGAPWSAGRYRGEVTLLRDGESVDRQVIDAILR